MTGLLLMVLDLLMRSAAMLVDMSARRACAIWSGMIRTQRPLLRVRRALVAPAQTFAAA